MPHCSTEATSLHLAEIAIMVSPGRHAVFLLDQARRHILAELAVPPNITLLPRPPRCPEVHVMQNVWQFLRLTWLSHRLFAGCDDIVGDCCGSWNALIDQPWRIVSSDTRERAHRYSSTGVP